MWVCWRRNKERPAVCIYSEFGQSWFTRSRHHGRFLWSLDSIQSTTGTKRRLFGPRLSGNQICAGSGINTNIWISTSTGWCMIRIWHQRTHNRLEAEQFWFLDRIGTARANNLSDDPFLSLSYTGSVLVVSEKSTYHYKQQDKIFAWATYKPILVYDNTKSCNIVYLLQKIIVDKRTSVLAPSFHKRL